MDRKRGSLSPLQYEGIVVTATVSRKAPAGDRQALRYVARAGLLPELSRQTYDSLFKALREAILNGLDANATHIEVDFSAAFDGRLSVTDNGHGMDSDELAQSFMSLGGSRKFGEASKYGRIGIGSLALLHYAKSAEVETKPAGAEQVTTAHINHPWSFDVSERQRRLDEIDAGYLMTARYEGNKADHFTRVTLIDIVPEVVEEITDVGRFYALIDQLRRILPLPLPQSKLMDAVASSSSEMWDVLAPHLADYSATVTVKSTWGDFDLQRRVYGDGSSASENWNGRPEPILTTVPVLDGDISRNVIVAGYLLGQSKATPRWSGLTVRVQNVAVEERSFFDVESDPGFRKYITGEVYLLGDLDRARLINIDRASFNRESPDYQAVRRYMAEAIGRFKSRSVQRPQREKAVAKRVLDQRLKIVEAVRRACESVNGYCEEFDIPFIRASTNNPPRSEFTDHPLTDVVRSTGASAVVDPNVKWPYRLEVDESGSIRAVIHPDLSDPTVWLCGREFEVTVSSADRDTRPVFIRSRPPEILISLPEDKGSNIQDTIASALMLEMAAVLEPDAEDTLYERVLSLLHR